MRRFLLTLVLWALAVSAHAQGFSATLPGVNVAVGSPVMAFIVDCGGVDTNAGTLALPILTFTQAHTLMAASTNVKTTYVRGVSGVTGSPCTYTISSATNSIGNHSGEEWTLYPGDPAPNLVTGAVGSGLITVTGGANLGCNPCNNIIIKNLSFTSAVTTAPLFQFNNDHDIYILGNYLKDTGASLSAGAIVAFTDNALYIQGNIFDDGGGAGSGADNISIPFNNLGVYTDIFVTDNNFLNCSRFCVESQISSGTTIQVFNAHYDRNVCANCLNVTNTASSNVLSIVMGNTGANVNQGVVITVDGNVFSRNAGLSCTHGGSAIEISGDSIMVEGNTLTNFCFALGISHLAGGVIDNNTFGVDLTAATHNQLTQGGTYDSTEWVGFNYYINSGTKTQNQGCPGTGTPTFCSLGFNGYAATPPVIFSPSAPFRASFDPW